MRTSPQVQAAVGWFLLLPGCAASRQSLYVVTVPVADVRSEPGSFAKAQTHDPLQETQVLYGERVRLTKTEGAWALIEAIEQFEYTHHQRWQGYPGWVLADVLQPQRHRQPPNAIVSAKWAPVWRDARMATPWLSLPLGTHLAVSDLDRLLYRVQLVSGQTGWISSSSVRLHKDLERFSVEQKRRAILRTADFFLGDPYFWGGRSPFLGHSNGPVTGVDCSALVSLVYRSVGIEVPRDAHEQYQRARKVRRLKPADLIFLSAPNDPSKVVHVMLYADDDRLIEGPGTGLSVRRMEVTRRLGRSVKDLKPGDRLDQQTIIFGAYLP